MRSNAYSFTCFSTSGKDQGFVPLDQALIIAITSVGNINRDGCMSAAIIGSSEVIVVQLKNFTSLINRLKIQTETKDLFIPGQTPGATTVHLSGCATEANDITIKIADPKICKRIFFIG
ncbi:MAG: hypothetical protein Q7T72_14095 [Bacteroidales bacterium]|nr:hypothetical protein [Bacteroidales bacterium]